MNEFFEAIENYSTTAFLIAMFLIIIISSIKEKS